MGRQKINMLGERFGHLLVVKSVLGGWVCRCDCGTEKMITGGHLRGGTVKSCGCLTRELISQPKTHGKRYSRAWKIWSGIIQRCENKKNSAYNRYGGRGIFVCDQWKTFNGFYADMGDPPPGTSLERIDNDGPYIQKNCRWATASEQSRNKRTNRLIEIDGCARPLIEWCQLLDLKYQTVHSRLRKGWCAERALELDMAMLGHTGATR